MVPGPPLWLVLHFSQLLNANMIQFLVLGSPLSTLTPLQILCSVMPCRWSLEQTALKSISLPLITLLNSRLVYPTAYSTLDLELQKTSQTQHVPNWKHVTYIESLIYNRHIWEWHNFSHFIKGSEAQRGKTIAQGLTSSEWQSQESLSSLSPCLPPPSTSAPIPQSFFFF